MATIKHTHIVTTLLIGLSLFMIALANVPDVREKTERRIRIPFLGIGPRCTGCPQHFCDDDPAVIHGYCCGCARFYDNLPVKCAYDLQCPPNTYELCEDYEYMLHCCCAS